MKGNWKETKQKKVEGNKKIRKSKAEKNEAGRKERRQILQPGQKKKHQAREGKGLSIHNVHTLTKATYFSTPWHFPHTKASHEKLTKHKRQIKGEPWSKKKNHKLYIILSAFSTI